MPGRTADDHAYERGGLVPSLAQFLELVEFYALKASPGWDAKPTEDLRSQGVVAVVTALTMPCYHMTEAMRLMARLQPPPKAFAIGRLVVLADVDHVRIAVEDLDAAVEGAIGESSACSRRTTGSCTSQGVEEVLLAGHLVRLLGALGPDTPVGRFLERRGPGVHHVAYRVNTDVAAALERLRAEGVRLVDEAPRADGRAARRSRSCTPRTWAACSSSWSRRG